MPAEDCRYPLDLLVIDDGRGIGRSDTRVGPRLRRIEPVPRSIVAQALRMGLPNGALSCARRVEVFTWRRGRTLMTWLDVDEIATRRRRRLPPVASIARPASLRLRAGLLFCG